MSALSWMVFLPIALMAGAVIDAGRARSPEPAEPEPEFAGVC